MAVCLCRRELVAAALGRSGSPTSSAESSGGGRGNAGFASGATDILVELFSVTGGRGRGGVSLVAAGSSNRACPDAIPSWPDAQSMPRRTSASDKQVIHPWNLNPVYSRFGHAASGGRLPKLIESA